MKENPWLEYNELISMERYFLETSNVVMKLDKRQCLKEMERPKYQRHLLKIALGLGFSWYMLDPDGDINFCKDKNCSFTKEDYKCGNAWGIAGPYEITPWGKGPIRIRKLLSKMNHHKEKYKGEWL